MFLMTNVSGYNVWGVRVGGPEGQAYGGGEACGLALLVPAHTGLRWPEFFVFIGFSVQLTMFTQ